MKENDKKVQLGAMKSKTEINPKLSLPDDTLELIDSNLAQWLEAERQRAVVTQAMSISEEEQEQFDTLTNKIFDKLNIAEEIHQLHNLRTQIQGRIEKALDETRKKEDSDG